MAEAAPPEKVLDDATLVVNRVHQKDTIHNVVLSWRLTGYEELLEDVMYHQSYKSLDVFCTLRILKRSDTLYMCVVGANIPQVTVAEFLVMREPSLESMAKRADEIESQIFAVEFPRTSHFDRGLDSLGDDGILTVSFKYASDYKISYKESSMEDNETLGDLDGMCCDLKNMYYEALCWDFLIHVGEFSFKTHKFVISPRCKFFRQAFKKNKDISEYRLENFEYPGIFHEVLVYIYSADLKEMDVTCMLQVCKLAYWFGVRPLLGRCIEYFGKNLTKENCLDVSLFAERNGFLELRNVALTFVLNSRCFEIVKYKTMIREELQAERISRANVAAGV